MSSDDLYEKKKQFVEEVSLIIEDIGQPRIAGQIMGWLMICDPPKQSFSDLVKHLGVSKASISNMTRLLLQAGLIEKVRIPGERKIHFQIKEDAWINVMENHLRSVNSLRRISNEGLKLLDEDPDTDKTRLEEMNKFYRFAEKNMPKLVEQYKKEHLE